ncbi:MAG: aminotransferase class I/II-fold pyridoxal phosphate-dependent enzyme [Candidatus Aminicenantes bacterium]|nr:aminotransferase class I/II-fold pyridoxal phosphate-dependent enzyme [Candidatus Aminicenantes bacterium]
MNTTQQKTPLLEIALSTMPDGIQQTISSEPIIPAIAAKAKVIAQQNPEFIRSDQGQILDIFPEKEIYYGPSAGLEELRDLIGRFWTLTYRLKGKSGIPPEGLGKKHVAIVTGATEGLSIVMHLVAFQQNVGLLPLYWSNYRGIILNAGGNPVILDFFDENYNPDFKKVQKQIEQQKITSLLINFPTNPSGDVLSDSEMEQLAELARRMDLILISDEVYGTLRYKGIPQSMLAYAPERTVIISSASKEYLIPGARIGYGIAADETFTNSWMSKMIRSFSSSPNVLGQHILIDILKEEVSDLENGRPPRIITEIKEELRKRCELIIQTLEEKGFTLAGRDKDFPSGAISVLARLPADINVDDKEFVQKAMEMGKFSAVPASVFGAPGCIRIGYAGMTQEKIGKFTGALQDVLDSFRHK